MGKIWSSLLICVILVHMNVPRWGPWSISYAQSWKLSTKFYPLIDHEGHWWRFMGTVWHLMQGVLHWVAQPSPGVDPLKVEVRLFDKLFLSEVCNYHFLMVFVFPSSLTKLSQCSWLLSNLIASESCWTWWLAYGFKSTLQRGHTRSICCILSCQCCIGWQISIWKAW